MPWSHSGSFAFARCVVFVGGVLKPPRLPGLSRDGRIDLSDRDGGDGSDGGDTGNVGYSA